MVTDNAAPPARDTEKMIRQLSLVAVLMSQRGRGLDPRTIFDSVEGYNDGGEDQNFDSFTRRFYSDREELARIGINIVARHDEYGEGDIYSLPPENYFLPAVEFSPDELAALNSCLCALDGQFAYSRLVRLALQSLALGTGNALEDPVNDCFSINLMSSSFDDEVAAHQRVIESARSRRKTIRFDYGALSHDGVEQRLVDPYAMMLTRGEWYLVGFSHERGAIRIFKLRRIQGHIGYASKNEHNFEIPEDFRVQEYLSLEPWQLGPIRGEARIEFSPRRGWWAGNVLAGCGDLEMKADGGATFSTPYSNAAPLCSLVLGMHGDARITGPAEVRQEMSAILQMIINEHAGEPAALAPPIPKPAPRPRSKSPRDAEDAPQVAPERFSQMAKTIAYLMDRLGDGESVSLPADEVRRDLGFRDKRELEQAMDLLRLVSTGPGGYLVEGYVKGDRVEVCGWPEGDTLRKPAHLSPLEARALLLAIDLVGNLILGDSFQSLAAAREKILAAAGGLDETQAIAVGETEKEDYNICRVINAGLTGHRLVRIEYLKHGAADTEERLIEPYLVRHAKGQWYLVAWCRQRDAMRTFRFEMIKSAQLMEDAFEPRDPATLDLERYLLDPRYPSGRAAPQAAILRFKPDLSRWLREKHSDISELQDGSLIVRIPWFGEDWLVDEVLSYGGAAALVSPATLRQQVADTAAQLAEAYK
ncbi:MAG: helix-turn-helix transcriptional regulator [Thermoleophilia bacterium]